MKVIALCLIALGATCDINLRHEEMLNTPFALIPKALQLQMYSEFVRDFNKEYSTEKMFVFLDNLKKIADHNSSGESTYKLGINFSADMTFEEFSKSYLISEPQDCSATVGGYVRKNANIPDSFDWRDKDMVSPVKNQGSCGSCWTFSSTGALEAHARIYLKKNLDLAEQQLVDCAGDFDNNGCSGGLPSHAFTYLYYRGGIQQGSDYKYKAKQGACVFDINKVVLKVPGGSVNITAGAEPELTEAVATEGPVSIAFQVVDDFRLYRSGVYTSTKCKNGPKDVNHAVLAVGYGNESGKDFYTIKNSWGAQWGMSGYFKMERGVNMCGVAVCNSFPKLLDKESASLF